MIDRPLAVAALTQALSESPAVALLGPRQVGKTTLALMLGEQRPAAADGEAPFVYLDLESPADRAKLQDAELYLGQQANRLVILDEIQRLPELFQPLRGLIDAGRRHGRANGRFLLLGSASLELQRQSSESLAGRLAQVELAPLHAGELPGEQLDRLWLRGGFPLSLLARSDAASLRWRQDFIRTYLERDIPQLGPRIAAETLRRFWTMLAHQQGGLLNAAQLARGLGVDGKTAAAYLDLLCDLLLVRRLPPWHSNAGKRLVKSPKVYVRDSGLVHALLGLGQQDALLGHPVAGGSWEGFVIESLLACAPIGTQAHFYRSAMGAEIDLLLQRPDGALWAVEIKRSLAPRLERGFHQSRADLHPARSFVVYAGRERYPLTEDVEAIGLSALCGLLQSP